MNHVTTCDQISTAALENLLGIHGLQLVLEPPGATIPGSFWGEPEAGLIGNQLFIRPDTPVHSLLHESCHYICMSDDRREQLDTDAGGDYDEENAVCYLQILLAAALPGYSAEQCMRDMDRWGYSFRLGNAKAWFTEDAKDARNWLIDQGITARLPDNLLQPTEKMTG